MVDKMDLVACCYEKFLFGFSVDNDAEAAKLRKASSGNAQTCSGSGPHR